MAFNGPETLDDRVVPDDLARTVYCVLGIPVDAIEMLACVRRLHDAAKARLPFLLSTPNLNFLAICQSDREFRESLLKSDLCPADGMPIVWLARILGIPIKERVSGSDIFDALRIKRDLEKPLKVFLFGGAPGAVDAACRALNAKPCGVHCVGSLNPGFGTTEEFSGAEIIDTVNANDADFLIVALGAQKGQSWLLRNYYKLKTPIRAHLGAAINFQAGKVARSPPLMQKLSLEWLWRIKQEPYLWRRYWHDGIILLRLASTRVLALVVLSWWFRLKFEKHESGLVVKQTDEFDRVIVRLTGPAIVEHIGRAIPVFRSAIATRKPIVIDFSQTCSIDARFLGLLLMLRKTLKSDGADPIFKGLSPALKAVFRLNGLGFLLNETSTTEPNAGS